MDVLRSQVEEYKQGWQRAMADYKNLQKETNEKKSEWAHMSEQFILEEFIPVYDNFKKAFAAKEQLTMSNEQDSWAKGVGFIMKQFWDVLRVHQISEIKTVGEKFDPKLHETAGEEEGSGEPGTIIREVDGGYMMHGRVMKVARVIVVK
jgi:molecular chaperone GrpE